jgi:hypothetical protein
LATYPDRIVVIGAEKLEPRGIISLKEAEAMTRLGRV